MTVAARPPVQRVPFHYAGPTGSLKPYNRRWTVPTPVIMSYINRMKILVTGGCGYIGSHLVVELASAGHTPVIVDNLSNSSARVLKRLEKICGAEPAFYNVDLCDYDALLKVFDEHKFDAAVHIAGLKAVGESVQQPIRYYRNNLVSTLNLVDAMQAHGVHKLVFSSSATVYGDPEEVPIVEGSPLRATNPYGQTKLMLEQILRDVVVSNNRWQVTILRYFNPVGAHESGLIGEDPQGEPNNLVPYIAQVAVGKRDKVKVFGNDYETSDGTGVRDYLHVVDLAKGHLNALAHMPKPGDVEIYNLGTGRGYSVLEMINAIESASGRPIAYDIVERRPGDIAVCYADPSRAERRLGWRAEKTIDDMAVDTWRWQQNNPHGYK
jgi:UDP-glucose 4-epimerase